MNGVLESSMKDLGEFILPKWQGRQKYMHTFDTREPVMAEGYEDYGEVVTRLCRQAEFQGVAHMTVDEKVIKPGMSQRRPGAHVDGCFMPEYGSWGHGPGPSWAHYCNHVPVDRMAVIVASSVPGCIVYEGRFEGEPRNDGDLEHIRNQFGKSTLLPANRGFELSPDCVHESVVFLSPIKRSFLRIALSSPYPE